MFLRNVVYSMSNGTSIEIFVFQQLSIQEETWAEVILLLLECLSGVYESVGPVLQNYTDWAQWYELVVPALEWWKEED